MAENIRKVVLAKEIDGAIEYLYPKSTADMVLYTSGETTITVQEKLDALTNLVEDMATQEDIDSINEDLASHNTAIESNTNKITSLQGSMSGINTKLSTAEGNISTNAGKIADIESAIEEITDESTGILAVAENYTDGKIRDLNIGQYATTNAINQINSKIDTNTTNIATNTDDIASIKQEQITQNTNISNNTKSITANANEITAIKTEQGTQNTNISNNAKAIATNKTATETNVKNITANANEIAAIKTEQSTQNTNISNNTTAIAANAEAIEGNTNEIAAIKTEQVTQNTNIKTNSDNITKANNNISSLNTRCNELEESKINMPLDEYNDFTDGYEGQILQSNGDGTTKWIDFIPANSSTITLYNDRWEYDNSVGAYGQVVTVTNYNITQNSQVNLRLSASQAVEFQNRNFSFMAETITTTLEHAVTGEITYVTHVMVYSIGDVPTEEDEDYVIQVVIREVA